MINESRKKERGISLISLVITIVVLVILTNVIIYNLSDNLKVAKLKEMQNDIANLRDKISSYYAQNGQIPARIEYENVEPIRASGAISDAIDTGTFLIIDLSALENLTLNYGKDFEKVKENPEMVSNYKDLYIINEASHNIFYVAGISIDNEWFYTDTAKGVDTVAINLRYVENVKIPDGYSYVKGNKETGIVIKNDVNDETYTWRVVDEAINQVSDDIVLEENKEREFLDSVNCYKGYYESNHDSSVIFIEVVKMWSPIYDKEGIYKDKNGDSVYIPKGFQVSQTYGENTIEEGLVVKDTNNNEWVWIQVPKSQMPEGLTFENEIDYTTLETALLTYAHDSSDNTCVDNWYTKEQHGLEETEYKMLKEKMLKSIYDKGGFYIGRYEAGTNTARTSKANELTPVVIQQDAYPYNFVTCSQAQSLSKNLVSEGRTSSLMFGIQWDLVLKYLEVKGAKSQNQLREDSSNWGNYSNVTFDIERGKYTANASTAGSWMMVSGKYTKPIASNILVTTGATFRNCTLNIYDLAGNVSEWILGYTGDLSYPCACEGGFFNNSGSSYPVSRYYNYGTVDSNYDIGFRPTLY